MGHAGSATNVMGKKSAAPHSRVTVKGCCSPQNAAKMAQPASRRKGKMGDLG